MSPRSAASAAATPPAMLAPARLWTRRVPVRPRIDATIAAVVVLPLVAETTTLPRGSRAASREMARGSARISTLPGSDVPPRPASAGGGAGGAGGEQAGPQPHGAITRNPPGTTRTVAGSSAIGSPSA